MIVKQDELTDILLQGAECLGISLPIDAIKAFIDYYNLLEERGKSVNLTAVSGKEEVAKLHFLDSICLLKIAEFKNSKVIDVGSGAGFPGIPLKIVEPTIDLTLLDSSSKRINFLEEVCQNLSLDAKCVNSRAEEYAKEMNIRESRDIAVSRAVARLNVLAELCLPFVKIGGQFIAMKSINADSEISEAMKAIEILGGKLTEKIDYTIPGTDIVHSAVIIQKAEKTSEKYPRRFARIQASPL